MDRGKTASRAIRRGSQAKDVVVRVGRQGAEWTDFPVERDKKIVCPVGPVSSARMMGLQLIRLARLVAYGCERNGGLWVHGALVEKNGAGVILAGPGGVGKSTAAGRLPRPWRMLSDDMCLIVRSSRGKYAAHPWPAFSRIRLGDLSGSWDARIATRVKLICMLSQHQEDKLEGLSHQQAVHELVDVCDQTRLFMTGDMPGNIVRRVNTLRFNNALAMARDLPVCRLHISLTGKFWEALEAEISE